MNPRLSSNRRRTKKIAGGIALALSLMVVARAETPTTTPTPSPRQSDPAYIRSLIDLARPEVRERKTAAIRHSMELTEAESAAFWAVHAEYEKEQAKLFDERIALIEEYAKKYESLTDAQARELGQKMFALEARRTALKQKYWPRFEKTVPARKVARFFQIDSQVNTAIDLNIAARLPLIK